MDAIREVRLLVEKLDSLDRGPETVTRLVDCGSIVMETLRRVLVEGRPSKIFQPRFWAVEALRRLGAKDVLLEYLFHERGTVDPEDRFGEEAVESAAARSLAAWPDEEMFRSLLKLSERRMLNGLIDALAAYERPETIPYFERALEDDFYRATAERALQRLGQVACPALVRSAVTPRPASLLENPSSIERRRSALRILNEIGITRQQWEILRELLHDPDEELVVGASRLGLPLASPEDRMTMARRLMALLASAPWHLQEDIEGLLVALRDESAQRIAAEIAKKMTQPGHIRAMDEGLRALLRVKRRVEKA